MADSISEIICEEDIFIERFCPIVNHIDANASFDFGYGGCMFETYGEEFEYVRMQKPYCIWTLIEEDGLLFVGSGLHIVNRLGYFVSQTPVQGDEMLSFRFDQDVPDDPDEGSRNGHGLPGVGYDAPNRNRLH